MIVRPARAADVADIAALLAPAIARGEVLPRAVRADEFLVAEAADGALVGAVALSPWNDEVVELGALVSSLPGAGVGSALARAAAIAADARGYDLIVALTHIPEWFSGRGFAPVSDPPWARVRGIPSMPDTRFPELGAAVGAKARKSCAGCAHVASCGQALVALRTARSAAAPALPQKVCA